MKYLIILSIFGLAFPSSLFSQNLDVVGKVKVSEMDQVNTADSVVVVLADGTLARRDVSTLSEFQVLTISNDTIYLTNGNFVKLPIDLVDDADANPSNELQTINKTSGVISLSNGGGTVQDSVLTEMQVDVFTDNNGYLTTEVDSSVTNEIQTLTGVLTENNDGGTLQIKNIADPVDAQDAATKAYVDLLEAEVDSLTAEIDSINTELDSLNSQIEALESRPELITVAPIAVDDSFFNQGPGSVTSFEFDVLNKGTADSDPDQAFRYGNFIEITHAGSAPGSDDNLSLKGSVLSINDNGTASEYTDDYIDYTTGNNYLEKDSFYYVLTDNDGLKDTALVLARAILEEKLTASDAATGDHFGYRVAISGDYAIVGADLDDDNGINSGSAYIFMRSGVSWIEQAKITASDGAADDRFGISVAISGNYAIVGANRSDSDSTNSGSAYVFMRSDTSWIEQAKITASDGAADDLFGVSVAISGDYAIVGAYLNDDDGINSGSAYIFMRSGVLWTEQAKITASSAAADDRFGVSVAISGDYAIVGAYFNDDVGTNSGSAYIFMRSDTSWAEQAKITASDAAADDRFGVSVAISGDYTIVGAFFNDDVGTNSGSAYIFMRSDTSWAEQAKITASDAVADDRFGVSVAISDDYAMVGASLNDDDGSQSGSAYSFMRSGTSWTEQAKITASDAAAGDRFGVGVAISGDYATIGGYYNDDAGTDSGSAYIIKIK